MGPALQSCNTSPFHVHIYFFHSSHIAVHDSPRYEGYRCNCFGQWRQNLKNQTHWLLTHSVHTLSVSTRTLYSVPPQQLINSLWGMLKKGFVRDLKHTARRLHAHRHFISYDPVIKPPLPFKEWDRALSQIYWNLNQFLSLKSVLRNTWWPWMVKVHHL
jgi:hypothetical protein